MFLLSDVDRNEILLKSDSGYVIHFAPDGTPDYPSITPDETAPGDEASRRSSGSDSASSGTGSLILNLGSARDFDEKKQVKNFTGRISYRQRNAYGQLVYEGEIPASDQAVIVSLGDLIDMSDSTLVFVNIGEDDAWKKLLNIANGLKDELTGSRSSSHHAAAADKNDLKTLDSFIHYASGKCGITPPPEKKPGLFAGLFHRKQGL